MTKDEIEGCIVSEWESVRAGFHGGQEIWTTGVLNIGISPEKLIDKVRCLKHKPGRDRVSFVSSVSVFA